jgi:hypothetical protein
MTCSAASQNQTAGSANSASEKCSARSPVATKAKTTQRRGRFEPRLDRDEELRLLLFPLRALELFLRRDFVERRDPLDLLDRDAELFGFVAVRPDFERALFLTEDFADLRAGDFLAPDLFAGFATVFALRAPRTALRTVVVLAEETG